MTTLQILHASDLEGGIEALENAPNFAAIVDALESDTESFDASILISAGDNYIPGPFFGAAGNRDLRDTFQSVYQTLLEEPGLTNIREGDGRADITIMNILGFDASAVGNHEFDAGPNTFAGLLETDIRGTELGDVRWLGTQFPYLSANLDFSGDGDLAGLFTDEILPNTAFQSTPDDLTAAAAAPKVAPATVIERDGELIGVVGATTQILESITSTGGVDVIGPDANDAAELAAILQPVIDDVIDGDDNVLGTADDVNKIILASHLQQFSLEQALIPLLSGVDISVAGGSDTILANDPSELRPEDTADFPFPFVTTNADGDTAVIVSTDGEYSYVGRLLVEFDDNGVITSVNEGSRPFATTDEVVTDFFGSESPFVEGSKAALVQQVTDAVQDVVNTTDGNVVGQTDVFIEGRREFVRTEETTLGNLTADANLAAAKLVDPTVQVSLKNGGGIRAAIGAVDGTTGELLPTEANPTANKEEGDISQLDIENSLRFNNGLTLLTVSAEELKFLLEHGVAASEPGSTPGQFPQVGGLSFSFDPDGQAIEFDEQANVVTEGTRIQSLAILNDDGTIADVVVEDGELVGDPERSIRIVTLDFLFGVFSSSEFIGGDGYPFPAFAEDVVQLQEAPNVDAVNEATFAAAGSEQDALAEFLIANFSDGSAFSAEETPIEEDIRIQNISAREDTVLDSSTSGGDDDFIEADVAGTDGADVLAGGEGGQTISGGDGDDVLRGDLNLRDAQNRLSGGDDAIFGGAGNDRIGGKGGDDLLFGDAGDDQIWGDDGDDLLSGGLGNDTLTGDNFSGGQGSDTFAFSVGDGTDTVTDFEVGIDTIALLNGLSFGAIDQTVQGTDLLLETSGETLAVLQGVTAPLAESSFVQFFA